MFGMFAKSLHRSAVAFTIIIIAIIVAIIVTVRILNHNKQLHYESEFNDLFLPLINEKNNEKISRKRKNETKKTLLLPSSFSLLDLQQQLVLLPRRQQHQPPSNQVGLLQNPLRALHLHVIQPHPSAGDEAPGGPLRGLEADVD